MARRAGRVVLGVTGSIAAYKSPEIVRALVKAGREVRCALTPSAARFVTPLVLATLSRHAVAQDVHDPALWEMAHLSWAGWADAVLVAPATADFLARLAQGRAEGLLDALILAARCPVAVCPAMDLEMWSHRATQANVRRLREYGYEIWGPERGELASGKIGVGRLLEPERIAERLGALLGRKR
ncbi:MAG: phosphopantothenoylcysteine decarboxylase [Elusimicrobia bacterium]|nr:phosphopantothenoylcysteine decarboxylase [Elusimicrobiota bacterium]MDE2237594.1 phosphopantothenoylcysteine decarboxylase [Elusimicrobiota bacterium]MDE2425553.1 phosphopantothenoylcysteine decarboxylase [Elusimicrobiota bacterium]